MRKIFGMELFIQRDDKPYLMRYPAALCRVFYGPYDKILDLFHSTPLHILEIVVSKKGQMQSELDSHL